MRVYFFQHGLDQYRGIPGRYRYDVTGRIIDLGRAEKRNWRGVVYADGLADNTPGPNVDPHVFSDLIPWHLSFCNIDSRKPKTTVRGQVPAAAPEGAVLSEVVRPGDVVVFGNWLSTHILWCDTVLCVGECVGIPQRNHCLNVVEEIEEYWPDATKRPFDGNQCLDELLQSRTYLLGLKDSTATGGHYRTEIDPHLQIVGARGEPEMLQRDALAEATFSGQGFSFIPLRARQDSTRKSVRDRPNLFTMKCQGIAAALDGGSGVVALGHVFGRGLVRAIIETADMLVLNSGGLDPTALKKQERSAC
jgi:hypothetical protein